MDDLRPEDVTRPAHRRWTCGDCWKRRGVRLGLCVAPVLVLLGVVVLQAPAYTPARQYGAMLGLLVIAFIFGLFAMGVWAGTSPNRANKGGDAEPVAMAIVGHDACGWTQVVRPDQARAAVIQHMEFECPERETM